MAEDLKPGPRVPWKVFDYATRRGTNDQVFAVLGVSPQDLPDTRPDTSELPTDPQLLIIQAASRKISFRRIVHAASRLIASFGNHNNIDNRGMRERGIQ